MNRRFITAIVLATTLVAAMGCNNAGQGAVSGAGVGALSGLAIGSLTGGAGTGAAIGAIAGGVGGAVIGDQNRRKSEAAAQQQSQQRPAASQQTAAVADTTAAAYSTGPALGNLVGNWNVAGTIDNGAGGTLPVSGTARATIDKTYFVRIDLRFTDPRDGRVVEGTSVISQKGGRTIDMTNSFSSSPQVREFRGDMDASGSVFNLREIEPANSSRRIVIRLSNDQKWTADVWDADRRIESFTFTPAT